VTESSVVLPPVRSAYVQRYFLHAFYFDHPPIHDEEGAIFADIAAAEKEAGLGLLDTVSGSMLDHVRPVPMKSRSSTKPGTMLAQSMPKTLSRCSCVSDRPLRLNKSSVVACWTPLPSSNPRKWPDRDRALFNIRRYNSSGHLSQVPCANSVSCFYGAHYRLVLGNLGLGVW
jgi:hypothetical protein